MSLKAQNNKLADAHVQIDIIQNGQTGDHFMTPFQQQLEQSDLYPLRPTEIEIFQVNIGKMCNQTCKHCHVDAGPDRKEIMTKDIMQQCLHALSIDASITTVDITGGAPELHPHFRWFVNEVKKLQKHIIVRCNLTIILANKKYHDLPEFYKNNNIEVISSLPFYTQDRTDRQRGQGV
ncbi:MAG TPA: arsenosugar biosynthesis radical SAM protein ArsS, partial [Saprospiraceae bacterium]|nr:arsenosugar biosynthesis radical SAM protein ArsS [Saprospiraceae bacterium]